MNEKINNAGSGEAPNDGSTSPDSEGSDSTELRRKVTEQGEQMSEYRRLLDKANSMISSLQEEKIVDDSSSNIPSLPELVDNFYTEGNDTKENFMALLDAAARLGESKATEKFSKVIEPALRSSSQSTLELAAKNFFESKGVPDLADNGSKFWNFAEQLSVNDPVIAAAWKQSHNRGFVDTYRAYVEKFGDPAKTAANVSSIARKSNASLEDSPSLSSGGLTPELEKFLESKTKGEIQNMSFSEIDKMLQEVKAS